MKDNVNHPSHYETGKFECIEVMLETQGKEAVKNFCICNAFKYIYRHNNKNGVEDIKKAKWYLDKYIEIDESEECKDPITDRWEVKVGRAMENAIKEATRKSNKEKLVVTDKVLEDLVKGARKCCEDICNDTIHADNETGYDKGVDLKKPTCYRCIYHTMNKDYRYAICSGCYKGSQFIPKKEDKDGSTQDNLR